MFLEILHLLVEGMVSPLTTYRVYESYGFAFFSFLLLFPHSIYPFQIVVLRHVWIL
jgi:hypothetical protein